MLITIEAKPVTYTFYFTKDHYLSEYISDGEMTYRLGNWKDRNQHFILTKQKYEEIIKMLKRGE